jgi:Ca2+-binding RTX toxin-like protein
MRTNPLAAAVFTASLGAALLLPQGASQAAVPDTCHGEAATVPDAVQVVGTPGPDVVITSQATRIDTLGGNDVICVVSDRPNDNALAIDAGEGDDTVTVFGTSWSAGSSLDGGAGHDTVMTGHRTDAISLDLATGPLQVGDRAVPTYGFEDASLFAPEVTVLGTDADNTLVVAGCDTRVSGREGDDVLFYAAAYVFEGDPWADYTSFDCEPSTTMNGGPGSDYFVASVGDDVLRGGTGEDTINGRQGDDRIIGGGGNDRLLGGSGQDLIRGRSGRDRIDGGGGSDRLHGNAGNDRIRGRGGHDRMLGGQGQDRLRGDGGRDTADGQKGRDTCRAEALRRCEL